MLNIEKKIENEKVELSLCGRLDTQTAPELETIIKQMIPEMNTLVLDFAKLEYISSAGLRVLLSAHKAVSQKGGMKVCNVDESVMEIFEVTGFSDILDIE